MASPFPFSPFLFPWTTFLRDDKAHRAFSLHLEPLFLLPMLSSSPRNIRGSPCANNPMPAIRFLAPLRGAFLLGQRRCCRLTAVPWATCAGIGRVARQTHPNVHRSSVRIPHTCILHDEHTTTTASPLATMRNPTSVVLSTWPDAEQSCW